MLLPLYSPEVILPTGLNVIHYYANESPQQTSSFSLPSAQETAPPSSLQHQVLTPPPSPHPIPQHIDPTSKIYLQSICFSQTPLHPPSPLGYILQKLPNWSSSFHPRSPLCATHQQKFLLVNEYQILSFS